jgi:hypothetical protein
VWASGISSGFPLLSRSPGQVPHVLLTRSPLDLPHCCQWLDLVRLACVKHAASVRPEPGSNSPSRSCSSLAGATLWKVRLRVGRPVVTRDVVVTVNWHRNGCCCCPSQCIELTCSHPARPRRGAPNGCPHWHLTFILCSVFKERSGPAQTHVSRVGSRRCRQLPWWRDGLARPGRAIERSPACSAP